MSFQGRLGDKSFCSSDSHGCPSCPHSVIGPAIQGSSNVIVNGRPALRMGDNGIHAACCSSNTWKAIEGCSSVLINGKNAHRLGDADKHCGGKGKLIEGSPNVIVGKKSGTVIKQNKSKEIIDSIPIDSFQTQKQTLIASSLKGYPFCEMCENTYSSIMSPFIKQSNLLRESSIKGNSFCPIICFKKNESKNNDVSLPMCKDIKFEIDEITFINNHIVNKDHDGDFPKPEWKKGRTEQSPICYKRNIKVRLKIKFIISTASSLPNQKLVIEGSANFGKSKLIWSKTFSIDISIMKNIIELPLESNLTLPDTIGYYKNLTIQWRLFNNKQEELYFISTKHTFYTILENKSIGKKSIFWTLLEISCREAHGLSDNDKVVDSIFNAFRQNLGKAVITKKSNNTLHKDKGIFRMRDGKQLKYWARGIETRYKPLLEGEPEGRCGNWADFLISMYKVHGITNAKIIQFGTSIESMNKADGTGFLVKNWDFNSKWSLSPPFTHKVLTECKFSDGIKAQGMDNSQPFFFDHAIVKYKDKFYDPSYGAGPFYDKTSYEKVAIAGLGKDGHRMSYKNKEIKDNENNRIFVPKDSCCKGFIEYTVTQDDIETKNSKTLQEKPEETLQKIAQKFGIRSWKILYEHEYNNNFRNKRKDISKIRVGDILFIPFELANKKISLFTYRTIS